MKETVCKFCGGIFSDGSSKKRICKKCMLRRYVELELEYDGNGNPKCPDCGSPMIFRCQGWDCDNQSCSLISLHGKGGLYRIARDSVMSSSGLVAIS